MAREVSLIAEILTGAEKEYLHARLTALLLNGNHIGLSNIARINAAILLHIGERTNTIARCGGGFKIHRLAGGLHFLQ